MNLYGIRYADGSLDEGLTVVSIPTDVRYLSILNYGKFKSLMIQYSLEASTLGFSNMLVF